MRRNFANSSPLFVRVETLPEAISPVCLYIHYSFHIFYSIVSIRRKNNLDVKLHRRTKQLVTTMCEANSFVKDTADAPDDLVGAGWRPTENSFRQTTDTVVQGWEARYGQENAVCYAGRIPEVQAKEPVAYSTETTVPVSSRRSFIQVPVYRGAPQSLLLTPPSDNYFGTDGFGDVFYPNAPKPADYVSSEHAVNALIKLVTASPGEITIVCLGPLTNIALAVRLDPLFLDKVKQVIILGGSVEVSSSLVDREMPSPAGSISDLRTYIPSAAGHPAGQVTVGLIYPGRTNYSSPMASLVLTDSSQLTSDSQHLGVGNIVPGIEFNFYMDPDADFIVLNSTDTRVSTAISPIQMMPWETVLKRINISMEWRTKVLGAITTSSMALLNQAESQHLKGEYWYSSDTFAMAMALNPDLITSQTLYHANVETQGTKSRGAVFVDYDNSTDSPKNVRVVQNLDVEELKVNNIEYVLVDVTQRRLVKPFVCHFRAHVTVELRAKTTSRLVLAKKLRLGRAPKFPIAYSTIQEYASFAATTGGFLTTSSHKVMDKTDVVVSRPRVNPPLSS
uniref:Inosine/uridine-preferring nucleoside hydrolase domain-containing protein n=1 Tax=Timema douglasi TaxID=61478 RepID=A0A7R8VHP9_TIMDO|nr:unnamed protein product [Timema douglasi]